MQHQATRDPVFAPFSVPASVPQLTLLQREPIGRTARIVALGDVGFAGRVDVRGQPFAAVQPLLQSADIAFANLETPLLPRPLPSQPFTAPDSAAQTLAAAGFDLLHLANNHIYDAGAAGVDHTVRCVADAGIRPLGVDRDEAAAHVPQIWHTAAASIGWLGAGEAVGLPRDARSRFHVLDRASLLTQIQQLRATVDVVVVSIHAGVYLADYPKPAHYALAHACVAAGAQLVLFHNAHIVQGVQPLAERALICHNLGNGLFDWQVGHVQTRQLIDEQRSGAVFVFDVDATGVAYAAALPIWMDDNMQLQWAQAESGNLILDRLQKLSRDLDSDFSHRFRAQRAERTVDLLVEAFWHHLRAGNWDELRIMALSFRPRHIRLIATRIAHRLRNL